MEFDDILSSHLRKEPVISSDQTDSVATLSSLISSVLGSVDEWEDESSQLSASLYHPQGTLESSQGFNTHMNGSPFIHDYSSRGVSLQQQQHQTLPPFQLALPSSLISGYKPQYDFGVKNEKPLPWETNYCSPGTACESIDGHMNEFCFCSPVEAQRLENIVEIKIENPKNADNEIVSPHPFDISDSFNIEEILPDSKVALGCSRESPFWGLTVEQRQTHQTTFRYFPRSSEPSLWQGWPLDMPSGEGSNTPPDSAERDDLCEDSLEGHSKSSGSKRVEGKTCGVCGDKALGYNFNAVTCESCKAFFRRNALKNKEFRCPFNGRCEVTAVTRRFCQRCRLRKCFDIGMKKEWIMSEEDKKKKRKKIEENRARKIGDIDDLNQQNSSSNDVGYFDDPLTPDDGDEKFISKPSKPQAVVVGRVRIEEPINRKIRKISDRSDVHNHDSPVQSMNQDNSKSMHEDFASKDSTVHSNRHSPTHYYLASDLNAPLDLAPSHNLPLSSQIAVQFPFSSHSFQSSHSAIPTLLCENALTPPKEGLVADLLRTQSQGSAEEDCMLELNLEQKDNFEQVSNSSSENTYHFDPGVIIKVEKSEYEDKPPKSPLYDAEAETRERQRRLSHQEAHHSFVNSSSSSSLQEKGFKFNIRETLAIVQPGCKDIPSFNSNSGKDVMDSILNSAINAEYSGLTLLSNTDSLQLNSVESLKINELLEASRGLTAPLCEDSNFKEIPNPSLINVINLTEIAIRRLIKMSKKINAFKNLCQEDQIALLKAGCTEMMILRSVYAYDPDKEVWKIQQDHERFKSIKLKVLKSAKGNIYEEHKRFMLEFEPEWRQDLQIMALLSAIALFTPQRANVIHPDAVEHEQKSYFFLLKRYLESRYGGCIGKTNYYRLLKIIGDLHVLNEDHVRVFLDVNPKDVEPLLIEIFDLKRS